MVRCFGNNGGEARKPVGGSGMSVELREFVKQTLLDVLHMQDARAEPSVGNHVAPVEAAKGFAPNRLTNTI